MFPGGGFTSSRGTFGNVAKLCDMLCVTFGKTPDVCYCGGSDGNVFIWNDVTLKKVVKAHEGPLFAMHSLDKVSKEISIEMTLNLTFGKVVLLIQNIFCNQCQNCTMTGIF